MKHTIVIKDPAERFDLSYAFANNQAALGLNDDPLVEMANVAKEVAPGVEARTGTPWGEVSLG